MERRGKRKRRKGWENGGKGLEKGRKGLGNEGRSGKRKEGGK